MHVSADVSVLSLSLYFFPMHTVVQYYSMVGSKQTVSLLS